MPQVAIASIGTALPPRRFTQADVLNWGLENVRVSEPTMALYARVLGDDSIEARHLAVDDLREILETDHERILARFEQRASELSVASLGRALERAGMAAAEVDFLAVTTCTGYLCPGISSHVMERAGLRPDVRCADLTGMGCGAAVPALERASDFLAAHPDATAAVVSTEICSAAIFFGDAPELVVSNSIFGDGSAAAILRQANRLPAALDGPRPRFVGFRSLTLPAWREALRFRTEGGHLRNVLSRDVPGRAGQACRRLVDDLLSEHGLSADAIGHWVMHAGGRLVIDAVERALELPGDALDAARTVLRTAGNLSSPTVLFVLDEEHRRKPPRPGDLGIISAFGAGFAAHAALVEYQVAISSIVWSLDRRLGLTERATGDELMDTVPLSEAEVRAALRFLHLTNRRFGGTRTILHHLAEWSAGWPAGRTMHLLDVGTGAADIPAAVVRWARRRRIPIRVTAIDSAADVAAVARKAVRDVPEITVEQADLFDLAGTDRRFDIVTASLFLHHVPPERTPEAIAAIDRLATQGVIISDLLRSALTWAAVGALACVAGNRIVRHDAPLSVRRAFRVGELGRLAWAAGLPYLHARREGSFRVSLAGRKVAADG